MPVYRFRCPECQAEIRKIGPKSMEAACQCGTKMKRVFSLASDFEVREKRDKFKNKNIVKDIEKVIAKRSKEYFVKHEVQGAIQKCIDNFGYYEGIRMAKRFGWIDKNSEKIRKKEDLK